MDYGENRNDLREWVECNIYGLDYCLEKVKLISLISEVLESLPSKDREIIMYKRSVRFVAPITVQSVTEQIFIDPNSVNTEKSITCRCSKCNELHLTPQNGRNDIMVGVWLVCLSPDILKKSRQESVYTIAHELAHVYLDHQTADGIEGFTEMEIEMDKQLIKWKFEPKLDRGVDRGVKSSFLTGSVQV